MQFVGLVSYWASLTFFFLTQNLRVDEQIKRSTSTMNFMLCHRLCWFIAQSFKERSQNYLFLFIKMIELCFDLRSIVWFIHVSRVFAIQIFRCFLFWPIEYASILYYVVYLDSQIPSFEFVTEITMNTHIWTIRRGPMLYVITIAHWVTKFP